MIEHETTPSELNVGVEFDKPWRDELPTLIPKTPAFYEVNRRYPSV